MADRPRDPACVSINIGPSIVPVVSGRFGSFTSLRVCPLSKHCGHKFLKQGRDGPDADLLIPFNPTSSNRARPSEHSLTAGQCSHGRVIVGYVPDRSGPASSGTLQNCVARMRRANLDHVRNGRLPVVTRQPDAAGIYNHSPIPQANHSRNVSVSAEDDLGVDSFGSSLNSVDRTRAYAAVDGHVVEPKSSVVPRRCVAKEHLFSMHKRGWHTRHPIEVLALKLQEITPSRGACLPEFNKNSILIAPHRRKASLNQQVRSSGRLEWAAYMIPQVHDLVDAEGRYVRKYGTQVLDN